MSAFNEKLVCLATHLGIDREPWRVQAIKDRIICAMQRIDEDVKDGMLVLYAAHRHLILCGIDFPRYSLELYLDWLDAHKGQGEGR